MRAVRKRTARAFALMGLAAVALGACYMPIRFDAEITITRQGFYDVIFDGYLADIELYRKLQEGKITRADELKRVARIEADFTRDSSTKEFKYYRLGHFKVHWEKKGDLLRAKSVTFFRRNEQVFSIRYNDRTGRATLSGAPISLENKKRLAKLGLDTTGEMRVITDAKVLSHNATRVRNKRGGAMKIYTWKINSLFDPAPSMIILF